jgi:hypothetical protein
MPIRHMIWAGLFFLAAAGWGANSPPVSITIPATSASVSLARSSLPHVDADHVRYAAVTATCVVAGTWVWLAGRWIRTPRRYTPQELGSVWEN